MRILLTGAAGFIGFHTALALLRRGDTVLGCDNLNDYYPLHHKESRLEALRPFEKFSFKKLDLIDTNTLNQTWNDFKPDQVLHLAAQAGVRYSIENPHAYIQANIVAFQNVIELVRTHRPNNFIYASSSSVYGGNSNLPFRETDSVQKPISLYAATKLSNELVAHTYSHLFDIPSTGLRFFTVYGSHYRPDMAIFKFAERMRLGQPIQIHNYGQMTRDFTYIDDIVDGILKALDRPELAQIYNFGKGRADALMDMIATLESSLEVKAKYEMLPAQAGDVDATLADTTKAEKNLCFSPKTSLADGLPVFAKWFREYTSKMGGN